MRIATGFSSNSLPGLTAGELAAATVAAGGDLVDLRLSRRQGWESGGVCAGLRELTRRGVAVAFIATPADAELDFGCTCHGPGVTPVKVAITGPVPPEPQLRRLMAAAAEGWSLLFETHAGGLSADQLVRCCAELPARLVFDNRGFVQLGGGERDLRLLAPHVAFVQLKGFDAEHSQLTHRPLRRADLEVVAALLDAGAHLAGVTVETKAGVPERDLALVNEFLEGSMQPMAAEVDA